MLKWAMDLLVQLLKRNRIEDILIIIIYYQQHITIWFVKMNHATISQLTSERNATYSNN